MAFFFFFYKYSIISYHTDNKWYSLFRMVFFLNNRNLEEYSWEYFAVTVTKED